MLQQSEARVWEGAAREGEIRPTSRGAQRADAAELAGDVDGDGVGEARFTSGRLGRVCPDGRLNRSITIWTLAQLLLSV